MSRYFTEEHEWIDVDGDIATVGITEYAQEQLGDIVFVELPAEGAKPSRRRPMSMRQSPAKSSKPMALWKKNLRW